MSWTGLTSVQQQALLRDLQANRVSSRKGGGGRSLSYVEAWDIKRMLIRVFGFGGFSTEVIGNEFRYESMTMKTVKEKQDGQWVEVEREVWDVAYQATVRLTIPALGCVYAESAVGSAMGSRAEAHDNAIKNAASDALKRAAIFLGTQFGLSLYNNGSLTDVVQRTLVGPQPEEKAEPALSIDVVQAWRDRFAACADRKALSAAWVQVMEQGIETTPYDLTGRTLLNDVNERLAEFDES